jgi:REP element-mobilizing transposase RayT
MGGMKYDPNIHRRRTVRLQGYDYSQAGAYFITLCTQGRECLFGDIADRQMRLNDAGKIVAEEWMKTAEMRDEVELDEWMVMPNHFHGIIVITCRDTARRAPTGDTKMERFGRPVSGSVPTIVRAFKSAAARRINEWRQTPGSSLWQRNYWEHVIRDEPELNAIREYVHNNPAQWELDTLFPCDNTTDTRRGTACRALSGNATGVDEDTDKGTARRAPTRGEP